MTCSVGTKVYVTNFHVWANDYTQILILGEATLRFVLKVFSVLRR